MYFMVSRSEDELQIKEFQSWLLYRSQGQSGFVTCLPDGLSGEWRIKRPLFTREVKRWLRDGDEFAAKVAGAIPMKAQCC